MAANASLVLIVRRAGRALSLMDVLVPLAVSLLYGLLWTGMPFLGPAFSLLLVAAYPIYLLNALREWSRGGPTIGRSLGFRGATGIAAILMLLPAVVVAYLVRELQPVLLRDLLAAALLCWLPASFLVLALGDSLVEAFHPASLLRAMQAMGGDYLRVWVLGSMLMISGLELALRISLPFSLFVVLLAATLSTAILGAAAYGRRGALRQDVDVDAEMETVDARSPPAQDETLRRYRQIRRDDGDEAALDWLEEELDRFHAPFRLQLEALRLAAELGRVDALQQRGARLVRVALEGGRHDEALTVSTLCVDADPSFCLGELDADDRLIDLAESRGRHDLVLALCLSFNARYARYRRSVDRTLVACRLLIDRYDRPHQARALLQDAIARGAKDEQLEQVRAMLKEVG